MCLCGSNIKIGKQQCCIDLFNSSPDDFKLYSVTAFDEGDYYETIQETVYVVSNNEENALIEAKFNGISKRVYGNWDRFEVGEINNVSGFKVELTI